MNQEQKGPEWKEIQQQKESEWSSGEIVTEEAKE